MNNSKWFIFSFLATMLIISSIPLSLYLVTPDSPEIMDPTKLALNKFASYEELKTFLETKAGGQYYPLDGAGWTTFERSDALKAPEAPSDAPSPQASGPSDTSGTVNTDYSKTNIQVEGVDEADIVKTDGNYIYIVSGNNVTIVKAYPPEEAEVISKIILDGSIMGLFINGDKLAIFYNKFTPYLLYDSVSMPQTEPAINTGTENVVDSAKDEQTRVTEPVNGSTPVEVPVTPEKPIEPVTPIVWEPPTTSIKVYDISDKEEPVLKRDFSIDGNYFNSRMIGDYVYVVATMYAFYTENDIALPRIHSNSETVVIPANDIYYYNFSDNSYTFTTIVALNINNDTQEATHETIMLGGTSAIYVSPSTIYITLPDYPRNESEIMKTTIYSIKIDKQTIIPVATGAVPGYLLNQFSMDEHNGYFRIATTVNNFNFRTFDEGEVTSKNNLYILDLSLNVVGKLENLAPGEQIYSTRFMDDRCYMVTFRNIDPLFVIDLADPTAPQVLGQLKVTGYSGYLHIYDENHIIGIGKETTYNSKEDFAWYQGVKISLFDVSEVLNPIEVAKYEIGDRGTDSPILYDHKSLLFDRKKSLLVIPVLEAKINEANYDEEVPDNAYGEPVWQGAYVLNISLEGIELRGKITHMEDNDLFNIGYYYYYSKYTVQRSLFIENLLYTISSMKVKMNELGTLAEIKTIELS